MEKFEIKNINISLDVDETLTDFLEKRNLLIKKYIEDNDLPYKILDMETTISSSLADWPMEECIKFWHKIGASEQLKCKAKIGCVEIIKKLHENGNKIIIVTARQNNYFDAKLYTEIWLKQEGIIYDEMMVGQKDKKQAMIDKNIGLVIDDSITTIRQASELGIPSIIISTKPNQKEELPQNCTRLDSWEDFEKYFKI